MTTSDTGEMMLRLLCIKPQTARQLYRAIHAHYPTTYGAILQYAYRYRRIGLLEPASAGRAYQLTAAGRAAVTVTCPHCGKVIE